jgi:hypothetical protein
MNSRPRRVRIFLAAQHDMVGPSAATTDILWRFFVGDLLDLLAVIAACSGGNVHALLEVLDPDVVGWADLDGMRTTLPQPTPPMYTQSRDDPTAGTLICCVAVAPCGEIPIVGG